MLFPLPNVPTDTFPTDLRALRHASHLSQEQVASLLQISRTTLGRYERGERPVPEQILCRCSLLFHPGHALTSSPIPYWLPEEEKDLLTRFRRLPAAARQQILALVQYDDQYFFQSSMA